MQRVNRKAPHRRQCTCAAPVAVFKEMFDILGNMQTYLDFLGLEELYTTCSHQNTVDFTVNYSPKLVYTVIESKMATIAATRHFNKVCTLGFNALIKKVMNTSHIWSESKGTKICLPTPLKLAELYISLV